MDVLEWILVCLIITIVFQTMVSLFYKDNFPKFPLIKNIKKKIKKPDYIDIEHIKTKINIQDISSSNINIKSKKIKNNLSNNVNKLRDLRKK